MNSHNRIPRGRILLVVIVALLAVAVCAGFLFLRVGREKTGAPDTSQPQTVGSSQTAPENSTDAEQTDPLLPSNPQTEPASEDEPVTEDSTGEPSAGNQKPQAGGNSQDTPEPTEEIASGDLSCDQFGIFSGQFLEDGRDELVENVAVVLVTNRTDRFLDFATLTFDIDGQTATFILSGLPAGRSAWVMEATRMTATNSSVFTYLNCVDAFRDDVTASTDKVTITSDGNMLTAVNNTSETLEGVFIYYRTLHTDGNFLGGITYRVDFGTLEPGTPVETLAGHFNKDTTEIVRIGWQTD